MMIDDGPSTESPDELRREFLAKRDSLSSAEIATRSRIILVKVDAMGVVAGAGSVFCYLPAGSEVDTTELVANLLERGRRVAIPVATAEGLVFSRLTDLDSLKPSVRGALEPAPGQIELVEPTPRDVLVVPGVVYGPNRSRLGLGDGLYDPVLAAAPCPRVAPVYDFQVTWRLVTPGAPPVVDFIVGETVSYMP